MYALPENPDTTMVTAGTGFTFLGEITKVEECYNM
jgi:hypothetical protein